MKKRTNFFLAFYILFLFSVIFGGTVYVGFATPRQYMTIVMSLYCLFSLNYILKNTGKMIKAYLLFILFYGISCFLEDQTELFVRNFISKYSVAIIGYFVTLLSYDKYKSFKYIIAVFFVSGLVNAIITTLQYFGNETASNIGVLFIDMNSEANERMFEFMVNQEKGRYSFGLLGDIVLNGYFSILLPFFTLLYIKQVGKNKTLKIIMQIVFVFSLFALFLTQQRSAFLLTILFLTIYLWGSNKHKLIPLIVFMMLIVLLPEITDSAIIKDSRFVGHESESRTQIYKSSLEFIQSSPFGGVQSAIRYIGNMPHNFILNALIYGGYVGGLFALGIIYKQLKYSAKWILLKNNKEICLAFVAYTFNGFFHNPSIVTGDVITWILWGIAICSCNEKKRRQSNSIATVVKVSTHPKSSSYRDP